MVVRPTVQLTTLKQLTSDRMHFTVVQLRLAICDIAAWFHS